MQKRYCGPMGKRIPSRELLIYVDENACSYCRKAAEQGICNVCKKAYILSKFRPGLIEGAFSYNAYVTKIPRRAKALQARPGE